MGWFVHIDDAHNGLALASFDYADLYYYRLGPDERLIFEWQLGWCRRCEEFVKMEELPTLRRVDAEIEKLESCRRDRDRIDAKNHACYSEAYPTQEDTLETWLRKRRWIQDRKSPPRCLECGSVFGVVALDSLPTTDDNVRPHPGLPGRTIKVGAIGHCSPESLPDTRREIEYDPEGNRLASIVVQLPTYDD